MRYQMKSISIFIAALCLGVNTAFAGGYYGGYSRGHHGYKHYGHHHKHDGDVGLALGFGLLFGTLLGHALSEPRYGYDRSYYDAPRTYRRYGPPRYYDLPRHEYRRPRVIYREHRSPAQRYMESPGRCLQEREYRTKVVIDGREVDAYGTACLQPDGSWRRGAAKQVPDY